MLQMFSEKSLLRTCAHKYVRRGKVWHLDNKRMCPERTHPLFREIYVLLLPYLLHDDGAVAECSLANDKTLGLGVGFASVDGEVLNLLDSLADDVVDGQRSEFRLKRTFCTVVEQLEVVHDNPVGTVLLLLDDTDPQCLVGNRSFTYVYSSNIPAASISELGAL